MAYALIGFPLAMAALTFATPSDRWRPWLLPAPSDIADRFFKTTTLWYHTSFTLIEAPLSKAKRPTRTNW